MTSPQPFKLTDFETTHALWIKLAGYYRDRLTTLRERNDGALSPEETARVRGQIAEIKQLLELAKPAPVIKPGDQ